jgi:hypothetical protein
MLALFGSGYGGQTCELAALSNSWVTKVHCHG